MIICVNNKVGKFQTFYGTKLCNVDGCFRRAKALGYCLMHYGRIRQGCIDMRPDPLPHIGHPKNRICSVDGCHNKHWQHGYCRLHWSRVERTGSPHLKIKSPKFCIVDGCQKKSYAKEYCEFHYIRFIRGLPFDAPRYSFKKGEGNCNWKGGVAAYPNHSEMKRVRKQKIQDSGGKCAVCGKVFDPPYSKLQIHHIDGSKDNHSYDNLLVACQRCAYKFHRGRKNKTSKIIREYGLSLKEIANRYGGAPSKYYYYHKQGILNKFLQGTI